MKKKLQTGLILGMIILCTNTFGQTKPSGSEEIRDSRINENTHFDLLLNLVGTNLNYGSSNGSLKDYKKSVLGAQVGVSYEAGVTPKFSLVSELYFMMKGGELKANNPLTATQTTLRLYTFELPVLARFHAGKFYMNAGPSIAYNINGTRKVGELSTHVSFTNTAEAFKRLDAGIQMGGGYIFRMGQKKVALDIRYCYGLTNISYDKEMYNRCLNLSIHFSKAQ